MKKYKPKTKYYYTMREMCNITGLEAHVLRFWETKFPKLRPRRKKNRNRRYTSGDIRTIKKIKYLLYDKGYTIKGAIQRLKSNEKIKIQKSLFPENSIDKKNLLEIREKLKDIKKLLKKKYKDNDE